MIHNFNFLHSDLVIEEMSDAHYIIVEKPTHDELAFIQNYFKLSIGDSETDTPHLTIPICKHYNDTTTLQLFSPIEVRFENTLSVEHKTSPLFIMIKNGQVLLVTQESFASLNLSVLSIEKIRTAFDPHQLFITIIETITTKYIQHAETLIQQLEKSETILRDSRKNDEFIILSEIEESFLTLKSAIDTNVSIIRRTREILPFTKKQISDINNTLEKLTYLRNTFDNYSLICQSLRDSLATFISNDLNFAMRALAVITILIAIPNLFFGFFGMNVALPLAQFELAAFLILALVFFCIWLTYYLLKKRKLY